MGLRIIGDEPRQSYRRLAPMEFPLNRVIDYHTAPVPKRD